MSRTGRLFLLVAALFGDRAVFAVVLDDGGHRRLDESNSPKEALSAAGHGPVDRFIVKETVTGGRALRSEAGQTSPLTCLVMSLLAGLSTTLGAGGALMLPGQRVSREQMAFALALAGGVMLSVTILEFWLPLFTGGGRVGAVVFYSLLGAAAFAALSYFVPEPPVVESAKDLGREHSDDVEDRHPQPAALSLALGQTSHQHHDVGGSEAETEGLKANGGSEEHDEDDRKRRWRLAFVLMLALTAHNFPEGFAVAISALQSDRLGLVVMFAIAMHNIPEGISIALPVYSATGSKWKALWMSFLSGMAEPLGAITALLLAHALGGALGEDSMENLLCTVGGVMCAVALKELLPEAWRQQRPWAALSGFASGFMIMWVTSQLGV